VGVDAEIGVGDAAGEAATVGLGGPEGPLCAGAGAQATERTAHTTTARNMHRGR
jgi:hypothetical protein